MHFFFSVPLKSSKEGADEEQHTFVTGDVVEVFEGDLANLKGTILSIEGNKITIMPKHEDLKVSAYFDQNSKSFMPHCPSLPFSYPVVVL